jgi:phospholipid/cholesterol/gamma-HCH transport system permease protein
MTTKVRRSVPEPTPGHPPGQVTVKRSGDQGVVCLEGSWRLRDRLPLAAVVLRSLTSPTPVRRVTFDTDRLDVWDTGLLTFLRNLMGEAERAGLQIDHDGLPQEVERLLALASAVPVRQAAPEPAGTRRFGRAVTSTFALWAAAVEVLTFTGEICAAFAGLFTRKVRIRGFQFALLIEEVGVSALPIMTLIGTLMGVILAFGGALQLRQLGVQIFIGSGSTGHGHRAGRPNRRGLRGPARLDAGEGGDRRLEHRRHLPRAVSRPT